MSAIAVLGTGTMGAPIARNLIAAGFDVSVWNRRSARAEPLAKDGARLAPSPAEAAASSPLVLTMLADGAAGIDVFFCDPHAPWQRGSNENTNGLLRQYFPKGFDFSTVTEADLDAVADELNQRPRKRFAFATPTEQLSELLLQ
jgi:hypothetical protein